MRSIKELWKVAKGGYLKGTKPLTNAEAQFLYDVLGNAISTLREIQEPAYGLMLVDMSMEQERLRNILEARERA